MINRRRFLKMLGYGAAGCAAIKMGGVAVANSLINEPQVFSNTLSLGNTESYDYYQHTDFGKEVDVQIQGMNGYGFEVGDKVSIAGSHGYDKVYEVTWISGDNFTLK